MIRTSTSLRNARNVIITLKNVEIFNQIIPLKQHLKTSNLEKFTMLRGSKQAIMRQEKWDFKTTAMRLSCNIYDFATQFTWNNAPKAYILKGKSNAFTLKKAKMK